jgi:tRNA pseudouridine38-40 synthase
VRDPLDVARMRAAAAPLAAFADFRAFTDDDPEEKSTRVLIDRIDVAEVDRLILIRVVGSHFLWKMVRRLAGVLVEAGRGGLGPDVAGRFLTRDSDIPARLAAPASGLFLERVFYEPPGDWPLVPALWNG